MPQLRLIRLPAVADRLRRSCGRQLLHLLSLSRRCGSIVMQWETTMQWGITAISGEKGVACVCLVTFCLATFCLN